jgi:hypothetical protein
MAKPTKRFTKWFERHGVLPTDRPGRNMGEVCERVAWRAYQRGRRDQQEKDRKVMEFLYYNLPEDSPWHTGKRR